MLFALFALALLLTLAPVLLTRTAPPVRPHRPSPRVVVMPDVMPDDWRLYFPAARDQRAREIAELERMWALVSR